MTRGGHTEASAARIANAKPGVSLPDFIRGGVIVTLIYHAVSLAKHAQRRKLPKPTGLKLGAEEGRLVGMEAMGERVVEEGQALFRNARSSMSMDLTV